MSNSRNKSIYIYCLGGLSNRLNSLITGLIISKKISRQIKPIIIWPRVNWCMASIYQILDKDWIDSKFIIQEENKLPLLPFIGHNESNTQRNDFYSIYLWPFFKNKFINSRDSFIVQTDLPPWWINMQT